VAEKAVKCPGRIDLDGLLLTGTTPGADGCLAHRHRSVRACVVRLLAMKPRVIVETGTQSTMLLHAQGMSTMIWCEVARRTGGCVYSVDTSEENIEKGKALTSAYRDVLTYVCEDSVSFLERFNETIDFLYLDSMDFYEDRKEPSRAHQRREIEAAFPKLSPEALVLLDDANVQQWFSYELSPKDREGKTYEAHHFLLAQGAECLVDHPHYQRLYVMTAHSTKTIAPDVKIFIPARHGLGNVLEGYFINPEGRKMLAALHDAWKKGKITAVKALYEEHMNPEAIRDLLMSLPLPVMPQATKDCPQVEEYGSDNEFPDEAEGYVNLRSIYESFIPDKPLEYIEAPVRNPNLPLPDSYVALMPYSGEAERFLHDPGIVRAIREACNLPVVTIGMRISRNGFLRSAVKGDINLCDLLTLTESLYVASKAALIVSSLSYLRTCSALFGVPVIELLEGAEHKENIVRRTEIEYRDGQYGISPLNAWFRWPEEQEQFSVKLKEYHSMRRRNAQATSHAAEDTQHEKKRSLNLI
jgi:hypothetical protein